MSVRLLLAASLGGTLALAGCASTGGVPRPSPFPTAPAPSSARQPPEPAVPAGVTPSVVLEDALRYQGVKYENGGESPARGFDCSGFIYYVFGLHHVELPRTVAELWTVGRKESLAQVHPGDLLFFSTTGPGPTHVALALGHDEFIHAPSSTGVVRIEHLSSSYWHARFIGARRIL